jgi:hypothetical protein
MDRTHTHAPSRLRLVAALALLAGLAAPAVARADKPKPIKPVVDVGSSVFATVDELITSAINTCRGDSGQLPSEKGGGDDLGQGLHCGPNDKTVDLAKVSCTYNGKLKIKVAIAGGAAGGDTEASVTATITSTYNKSYTHSHTDPCADAGTCVAEFVSWKTIITVDVKVIVTIVVNSIPVSVDASASLGGGVKNYTFVKRTTHGEPRTCKPAVCTCTNDPFAKVDPGPDGEVNIYAPCVCSL